MRDLLRCIEGILTDEQLASFLEAIARRFTPSAQDIDSVIEPILVLSSKFLETEQESIPDYFWPSSGKWKIRGTYNISSSPWTSITGCCNNSYLETRACLSSRLFYEINK